MNDKTIKIKLLKNLALGSFLFGSFSGAATTIEAAAAARLRALTPEQIQALEWIRMPTLTADQIQAMEEDQIRAMTAEQIQALTADQIRAMTARQAQALNERIQALGVQLTPEQNEALNEARGE